MKNTLTPEEQEKILNDVLCEKFTETVVYIFENKPEVIEEYDRLNDTNILQKQSIIANEIDKASGKRDDELRGFFDFVREYIFDPMVRDKL